MTLASAAKAGCFCGSYGAAEAAPFQNKVESNTVESKQGRVKTRSSQNKVESKQGRGRASRQRLVIVQVLEQLAKGEAWKFFLFCWRHF